MAKGAGARGGRRRAGRAAALAAAVVSVLVPAPAPGASETGPVTGLPLPRYVSLKATKANLRRGPGLDHRVDWVFVRRGTPLQITAEFGHWRRVRDAEGDSGWMHYSMLRGDRTALTLPEVTPLREAPRPDAPVTAEAAAGVILDVAACGPDWCEVGRDDAWGWAPKSALWGVGAEEVFD
jgi:SH3-like domain-containing protein